MNEVAAGLPIAQKREEIIEALRRHPVILVAGDTGSGKSTQLPQYCLAAGAGIGGSIAHTQPRRLAARALAARIAEERGEVLGATVGFRVRFTDRVSAATRLTLMTDGLLLAELNSDPRLERYDTVIVDEAHERSLNVDLLLGVLKRLLPKRPDLKVIVTSATLDVERMARFFDDAPVVAVGGRSYPVEVRYHEGEDQEDPDRPAAVREAYRGLCADPGAAGAGAGRAGDVLVFLPGEREIRDVGELLERELSSEVAVLPLYSRLAWEQQSRIFERGTRRRIVLATNVAETSITVPGVRFVIDTGLARISRYSPRNRLQRLPIEAISRASAEQRKGRCGRLGPGLCVRLYGEEEFLARPAFTEPEVLRTNLAALLLRLAADGLGAAEEFPFLDPPDARALNDGYRLLQELQALDEERRITRLGRAMARLPLDPRLSRALLESKRFHAESELLAIVAGLSVPDVRIADTGAALEESAAPWEDSKSEFTTLHKLWRAYRRAREGTRRELRTWCKERRLSLLRLSEWEDVYEQIAERAADVGIVRGRQPAGYGAVHRALLAGFCTMVGVRTEEGVYLGTRGTRFHIFPGSPLRRRKPHWVMAAHIVETSRVFARRVAQIEPTWIESAARHLLKREYLEPDWDEEREEVIAKERVGFLGLVLSASRTVNYGRIAPEEARRIFAREALVYERLQRRPAWLEANDAAIRAAQRAEERLRTRDLVAPAELFVDFYDRALPRQVSSGATLEHFTRHMTDAQASALTLAEADIYRHSPDADRLAQFPEVAALEGLRVPVEYAFAPGEAHDGASLRVPLLALPALSTAAVAAAVPGMAAPRIEALLRSLPKEARRQIIPVAATAAAFLSQLERPSTEPRRLAAWLKDSRGIPESLLRFDPAAVPPHLRPRVAVIDAGRVLAQGTDLRALRRECAPQVRAAAEREARARFETAWRGFDAEELPGQIELEHAWGTCHVFPALERREQGFWVVFEWSRPEADRRWARCAVELAQSLLGELARGLAKQVTADAALILAATPHMKGEELRRTMLHLTFRRACFEDGAPPRERAPFLAAVERGRARLYPALEELRADVLDWLTAARAVRRAFEDPRIGAGTGAAAAAESRRHLDRLLAPAVLADVPPDWLRQWPRYLKAEERRWQRIQARGGEPAEILREIESWAARAEALAGQGAAQGRWHPEIEELRWWIEEYRVSLYAQELKTRGPVSAARLEQRAAQIEDWLSR